MLTPPCAVSHCAAWILELLDLEEDFSQRSAYVSADFGVLWWRGVHVALGLVAVRGVVAVGASVD